MSSSFLCGGRSFIDSDAAQPAGTIVAIEEEFRGVLLKGYPEFLGYVDLVMDSGDELVARDYKTSRSRWNQGWYAPIWTRWNRVQIGGRSSWHVGPRGVARKAPSSK